MQGSQGRAGELLKDGTPAGGAFALFFSLQAGSVMTATVLLGLAFASFFYNISAPNPTENIGQYATQYAITYLFILMIFFGTTVVSIGAFKFSPKWVRIGSITLAVAAIVWFLLSLLCFIPSIKVYMFVCIHERCPPTVWLFEVTWRDSPPSGPPNTTQIAEICTDKRTEVPKIVVGANKFAFSAQNVKIHRLHGAPTDEDVNNHLLSDWFGNNKIKYNWSRLLGMKEDSLFRRPAKPFLSASYLVDPRSHSIGLTIFCFVVLSLFWMYSLWTMFSLHKELVTAELEEALESERLSHRTSGDELFRRQSGDRLSRRPSIV